MKPFIGRHTGVAIEANLSEMKEGLKNANNNNVKIETCVNNAANLTLAVDLCENCNEYRCNCHTIQVIRLFATHFS